MPFVFKVKNNTSQVLIESNSQQELIKDCICAVAAVITSSQDSAMTLDTEISRLRLHIQTIDFEQLILDTINEVIYFSNVNKKLYRLDKILQLETKDDCDLVASIISVANNDNLVDISEFQIVDNKIEFKDENYWKAELTFKVPGV